MWTTPKMWTEFASHFCPDTLQTIFWGIKTFFSGLKVSHLRGRSFLSSEMYLWTQCLSQDLETECLNLAVVKFMGVQIFKGDQNILIFETINIYKFIKIRHDTIKQCHGNYKEMKKFKYKLEIEIFRNSTQKIWVFWEVLFKGFED